MGGDPWANVPRGGVPFWGRGARAQAECNAAAQAREPLGARAMDLADVQRAESIRSRCPRTPS
eukprot:9551200-Heterocapsa_arctica.AAC.1